MGLWAKRKQTGFTIVELLIVIVVVAILATISIVAYNGVQDRTKYAKALSDLKTIHKSIHLYQAQNGTFPVASSWRYYCSYQADPNNFIPGLNEVLTTMPPAPCTGATNSDDTWIYRSDGTDYKLIYIRANVSSNFRNMVPVEMRDSPRWAAGTTWGYWSEAWASV